MPESIILYLDSILYMAYVDSTHAGILTVQTNIVSELNILRNDYCFNI